ncbi:multidrug transporter [Bacillaceae bacterium C204]|uniref:multidrug transporter n=1 Tax=Neobacillus sp. 204 TaxID=3383351 RepID=UPI00397E5905
MPLNTASLNALPRTLVTHGTAVNNTLRQISGAIGTAVVITVFTTQTTNHAKTLLEETPNATVEAIRTLASILGSSDAYYFMTILAIIAFVLTLFVPAKERVKQQS